MIVGIATESNKEIGARILVSIVIRNGVCNMFGVIAIAMDRMGWSQWVNRTTFLAN